MWYWLGTVSSGAALLLLARWALHVGRPHEDVGVARRVWDRLSEKFRDAWSILWRAYGPITEEMRSSWERLRARYQGGAYGTEGT